MACRQMAAMPVFHYAKPINIRELMQELAKAFGVRLKFWDEAVRAACCCYCSFIFLQKK